MAPILPKIKLTLFLVILSFLIITVNAQLTYIHQYCYDSFGRYSLLSDYETNVETAIDELASRASTTYYGKYATGLGEDRVIAVFSCRYDITNEDCQDCVASTANNVSRCFSDVEGLIVYEECTLHYSNRSISGIMEDNPQIISYSTGLDEDFRFNQLLDNTVTDLIKDVTSEFAVSSRYFATTTAEYSSSGTIYALAQCNPDISSINCRLCLRTIYDDFMSNYTGTNYGQIFTPSCRLSYILSSKELSEPWMFAQTFDERNRYRTPRYSPRYFASSGTRGSSIIGVIVITSLSCVALFLKLL